MEDLDSGSGSSPRELVERMTALIPSTARSVLVVAADPDPFLRSLAEHAGPTISSSRPDELVNVPADARFECVILDGLGSISVAQQLGKISALVEGHGILISSARNALHHDYLRSVLRSDLPSSAWEMEHAGYATTIKRLLDGGFLPDLKSIVAVPATPEFHRAAEPLLRKVRADAPRVHRHMDGSHHIFVARPRLAPTDAFASTPLSFISCVNDKLQLNSNLLASPCLREGTLHELIVVEGAVSVGEAFNTALESAANETVILVQQDMYLPVGWDTQFLNAFRQAREKLGTLGVVGLYGITATGRSQKRIAVGKVIDRGRFLNRPTDLPSAADSIDEILLAFPKETSLRLDPELGFHLYGTDVCLEAASRGLKSVVVNAPAFHNSLGWRPSASYVSESFDASRRYLLSKWLTIRPLYSNMGQLDAMTDVAPPAAPSPDVIIAEQFEEITRQQARIEDQAEQIRELRDELASRSTHVRRAVSRFRRLLRQVQSKLPLARRRRS